MTARFGTARLRVARLTRALVVVLSCIAVLLVQFAHYRLSTLTNSTLDGIFRLQFLAPGLAKPVLIVSSALASLAPLIAALAAASYLVSRRRLVVLIAVAVSLYYLVDGFLLLYRLVRRFPFDVYLVWYNRSEVWSTLNAISEDFQLYCAVALAFLGLHSYGVVLAGRWTAERSRAFSGGGVLAVAIASVLAQGVVGNEVVRGITPVLARKSEGERIYDRFYRRSLELNKAGTKLLVPASATEHLFLIHLESLNSRLVNERFTPRLMAIARRDGILFPNIQSSSVLTIRAQETILCSILPALGPATASSWKLAGGLVCLPRLLQQAGFRTFYFHSHPDIQFANSDLFMKWIGFDERHAAAVMRPGDQQLRWGYAEPIFYQRVFEYLERYRGQKIFAYIVINTTNHFPFYDQEKRDAFPELARKIPFPRPRNIRERLANTTFMQDAFFGDMYDRWIAGRYGADANVVILGDHAWPTGLHFDNGSNDHGAFQDNFLTSLAFVPAGRKRNRYAVGKTVAGLYSQIDIAPTLLELYGIKGPKHHGVSFAEELRSAAQRAPSDRCLVSVQPFSGKYISTIRYPIKRLYHLSKNQVATYDLEKDPDEKNPLDVRNLEPQSLEALQSCLQSLESG